MCANAVFSITPVDIYLYIIYFSKHVWALPESASRKELITTTTIIIIIIIIELNHFRVLEERR